MPLKIANNAVSKLAGSLTASATTMSVTPGDGAKFPALSAGDWFPLTLVKSDGTLEIVRCTARSTDTFTIQRAQESTSAKAFSAGDRVELRLTAGAAGAMDTSGNAGTATRLATARTIGGVSFDGGANINLPGVNTAGNQNTSGNAATATRLQTERDINGVAFNGTANIDIQWMAKQIPRNDDLNTYQNEGTYFCPANADAATLLNCPTTNAFSLRVWKAAGVIQELTEYLASGNRKTYQRAFYNTWSPWIRVYTEIDPPTSVSGNAGTATSLATARTIGGVSFDGSANINLPGVNTAGNQSTTGNAATATRLETARTINGTSFNGSANITTANWGTSRNLTIGSTAKAVNGSANVAWSLSEIGAAAASHSHAWANLPYTPIQQGGGAGQNTSAIKIGWNGSNSLLLQVDSTNFSATWPINVTGKAEMSLGENQAWVVGGRNANTTYTNTTGRAIFVMISIVDAGAGGSTFQVGGVSLDLGDFSAAGEAQVVSCVIPSGTTYRLNTVGATISGWAELR